MAHPLSPFTAQDEDRQELWEMLVARDITAFLDVDWDRHALDFDRDGFWALNGNGSSNPDRWTPYPLTLYAPHWAETARKHLALADREVLNRAHFNISHLTQIEIEGDNAVAHKKFGGVFMDRSGNDVRMNWQTVYYCRRAKGRW